MRWGDDERRKRSARAMWSGCYRCAVEEKPKRRTSDPWAKDSSFYKNSKVIGLISLVAGAYIFALAFGGNNCGDCGPKGSECYSLVVTMSDGTKRDFYDVTVRREGPALVVAQSDGSTVRYEGASILECRSPPKP